MSAIADIITKYSSMFGVAAVTTLLLSVFTVLFSFIIGSLLAVMKISSINPLRWLANIYVEFIRGTPLLVQVYVVFYGLPLLGVSVPSFDLLGNDFSRLFAGIIAVSYTHLDVYKRQAVEPVPYTLSAYLHKMYRFALARLESHCRAGWDVESHAESGGSVKQKLAVCLKEMVV